MAKDPHAYLIDENKRIIFYFTSSQNFGKNCVYDFRVTLVKIVPKLREWRQETIEEGRAASKRPH
jgi:hypothetical protein